MEEKARGAGAIRDSGSPTLPTLEALVEWISPVFHRISGETSQPTTHSDDAT
ncbi:MAG: hypothetical protein JRE40_04015 [Deltaproteobacteria bacterium]|nr:hypothetical protein [Deltaproteobacteria bacterium]